MDEWIRFVCVFGRLGGEGKRNNGVLEVERTNGGEHSKHNG